MEGPFIIRHHLYRAIGSKWHKRVKSRKGGHFSKNSKNGHIFLKNGDRRSVLRNLSVIFNLWPYLNGKCCAQTPFIPLLFLLKMSIFLNFRFCKWPSSLDNDPIRLRLVKLMSPATFNLNSKTENEKMNFNG